MLVICFPQHTKRALRSYASPRRAIFILYAARKRGLEQRTHDDGVTFYAPDNVPMLDMFPNERAKS